MRKKWLFWVVVLFSITFLPSLKAVDERIACEKDRTCCRATYYGQVNQLCWLNISWSDCGGQYCAEADWDFDDSSVTYKHIGKLHAYGADWHLDVDDLTNYGKGGVFGRPQFRSYGNVHDGLIDGGGIMKNVQCLPWKCMTETVNYANPPKVYTEAEGFVWEDKMVGWTAVKCDETGGCVGYNDTQNINAFQLKWRDVPTSNIAVVNEADYGCNDCLIIEYNETLTGTTYDPTFAVSFLLATHPKPDKWYGVGSSSTITLVWNMSQGEVLNITYATVRNKSDVADWMGNTTNYLNKEGMVRNWTTRFFRAFKYPSGFSEQNITDYYNGILSFYHDGLTCIDKTNTTNNYYLSSEGRCAVVNSPNIDNYHAMWIADSGITGLGLVGALNMTSPYALWVANMTVVDWLKVWVQNSDSYPTVNNWARTVRQFSLDTQTQPQGLWSLLTLNMYNLSIIDKTYMCNTALPRLRSNYQYFNNSDTDSDYLLGDGAGDLARDGTDVIAGTNDASEDGVSTNYKVMDAISLANIYAICGNQSESDALLLDFNKTVEALETFWNSSCNAGKGCYWNLQSGSFYDINSSLQDDWAATPFQEALPIVWGNVSSSRAEYLIGDLLKNNFTYYNDSLNFTGAYTSIPLSHPCFSSYGGASPVTYCDGGETWDGPIWAGVDNFFVLNAIRDAQSRLGFTSLADDEQWLEDRMLELFGIREGVTDSTPYGAESWDAHDGGIASWGSNPYGWGGVVSVSAVSDYNIFSPLSFSPQVSSGGSSSTCNKPSSGDWWITDVGCTISFQDILDHVKAGYKVVITETIIIN